MPCITADQPCAYAGDRRSKSLADHDFYLSVDGGYNGFRARWAAEAKQEPDAQEREKKIAALPSKSEREILDGFQRQLDRDAISRKKKAAILSQWEAARSGELALFTALPDGTAESRAS